MDFDYQPFLSGSLVELRPLVAQDYDALFGVASDPGIWEQHPVRNRYEEGPFRQFFDEALACRGTLVAVDAADRRVIGSSRFHGYDRHRSEVEIGWTFLARSHWGGTYNGEMKRLMCEHAFRYVDTVVLLIGPENVRSQRAAERIGAVRAGTRLDGGGRSSHVYRIEAPRGPRGARRTPFILTLALLGGLASCSAPDAPMDWSGTIADSAGVEVVSNPAQGLWAPGEGWALEEVLSFGGGEQDVSQFGAFGRT